MSALPFAAPVRALVRDLSPRYASCLRHDASAAIDLEVAAQQHAGYVAALAALGIAVTRLTGGDPFPDGCFVEDTAVLLGEHALMTRTGAPSRRQEGSAARAALAETHHLHEMVGEATLDGGDVLRVGGHLFVGRSARTNAAGIEALTRVAAAAGLATTTAIAVGAGLHLKSACTLAGPELLLYDPAVFDLDALAPFRHLGLDCRPAPEPAGANVLALGSTVLVSAAAPRTAALLEAAGLTVRTLPFDELHKGDGGLTCLSLRAPPPGHWCV